MIIVDNQIQTAKIKLAYIVTLPIGLLLLFSPAFISLARIETIAGIVMGALLLLTFIILFIINPQYFYFSIENNSKIIIRNYHAFPAFRKYKAFEMNVSSLQDYEIRKSFFGLLKTIRFTVLTKNKVGKYPWISLSAVSEKEIKSLESFLNKVLPPARRK